MPDFDFIPSDDYAGGVQPYSPVANPLPTSTPASIDSGYFDAPDQQYRGQALPPGVTPQEFNQFLGEISGLFYGDMAKLGWPHDFTQAAIEWYRNAITGPVPNEPARHNVNFSGISISREDQPWVTAFANAMTRSGHSKHAIKAAVWWMGELAKRLNQQQPASNARSIDDLSDAEFAKLERRYADDARKCEITLRRLWGNNSYQSNLARAQDFLNSLPQQEREHIANDVLADDTSALNSPDVVLWLHEQSLGGVSNILSRADLQNEIQAIEKLMASGSPDYWKGEKGEQTQMRLRHLYQLRDGG